MPTSTAADAARDASAGTSAPRFAISTVATAAIANVSTIHSRKPARKPDERPERDLDIGVEAAGQRDAAPGLGHAQNDEAHRQGAEQVGDGAVAPSVAAMSAGSRKMPPPMVTLTMLAASARGPMERRSDDSGDEVRSVKVTNARIQLRSGYC